MHVPIRHGASAFSPDFILILFLNASAMSPPVALKQNSARFLLKSRLRPVRATDLLVDIACTFGYIKLAFSCKKVTFEPETLQPKSDCV